MELGNQGRDALPGGDMTAPAAAMAVIPAFDAPRYWAYLDTVEASDAEKTALLEALWSIMAGFVQRGFGVDTVRTVIPALIRSSLADDASPAGADAPGATEVRDSFHAAARPTSGREKRR